MKPEISIIIPVWNRQDKIINTLKSVEKQTFKNIEVIIIDDGSDDDSVNVINQYKTTSPLNIKLFQIKHSGVSIARNYGIDNAKGNYIFFLDSDDYIFKTDVLEKLYFLIKRYDIDVVVTKFYFSKLASKKLGNSNTIHNGEELILNLKIINTNYNSSLFFCKKDFLNKHHIRFIENLYMEDRLFLFDLAYNNAKFYITDIISIYRTISNNSITNTNGKYDYHHIIIFKQILKKIKFKYNESLFKQYYNTIIKILHNISNNINSIYKEEFKKYLNELKEWGNESDFTNTSDRQM